MGKKSKRKQGAKKKPASSFAVPPRSTEAILGRIGPNSKATKQCIAELLHALNYELKSPKHQQAMLLATGTGTTNNNDDDAVPTTYETPGMLQLDCRLVCGNETPFRLRELDLPACQDALVLSDTDMGQEDSRMEFAGGSVLAMEFLGEEEEEARTSTEEQNALGSSGRNNKMGKFRAVVLGECTLRKEDLWDLAVQFRQGTFSWPGWFCILQCPFCANLAVPNPSNSSTYIMVEQTIYQNTAEGPIASRDVPRLCCKECFLRNLQNDPNDADYWELGSYPTMLRKSIPAFQFGADHPSVMMPVSSAYHLNLLYETTGIHGAVVQATTDATKQGLSGSEAYKVRISKSKTAENRGQTVIVMKSRPICGSCGVASTELPFVCGGCKKQAYCGQACAKRDWKTHKKVCGKQEEDSDGSSRVPQPSQELLKKKKKGGNTAQEEIPKCEHCQTNPEDFECPAMCVSCGTFIVCGPCSRSSAYDGMNGQTAVPFFVCIECAPNVNRSQKPGPMLRRLLDKRPQGRHVCYARLMLAQCMLNHLRKFTGVNHDIEAAKKEYLWLANNADYAPAQFAMATFYVPSSEEIWDGPLNLSELQEDYGHPPRPVQTNANKAKEYYNRAVENGFAMALQTVGTMYKNGDLFPMDKSKAQDMLKQAVIKGDPKAMCNLGQMKMRGDGIPKDTSGGIELYRQAADLGIFSAMFMFAQLGMQMPPLRSEGKKRLLELIEEEWQPPPPLMGMWYMAQEFYGV